MDMKLRRKWAAHRPGDTRPDRSLAWMAAALSGAIGMIVLAASAGSAHAGIAVSLAELNDSGVLGGLTAFVALLVAGMAALGLRTSGKSRQ